MRTGLSAKVSRALAQQRKRVCFAGAVTRLIRSQGLVQFGLRLGNHYEDLSLAILDWALALCSGFCSSGHFCARLPGSARLSLRVVCDGRTTVDAREPNFATPPASPIHSHDDDRMDQPAFSGHGDPHFSAQSCDTSGHLEDRYSSADSPLLGCLSL